MKAKKYLLFFLLGYCIYIAIEVTYRGYSFRLMGIAGGLSLAGIGMLEDAGLRRFPLAFQMMVSAVRTVFGNVFPAGAALPYVGLQCAAVFLLRWADLPVVFRDLVSALGSGNFSHRLCELLYFPRGDAPDVSKEEKGLCRG